MNQFLEKLAKEKRVDVFFRDDDVDEDEETLHRLLTIFADRKIPLIAGVIPKLLTEDCVRLLSEYSEFTECVQHGWQHKNYEMLERKCEFGISRNFAEQLSDLTTGQKIMNEAFGENWFPAFIPPWNRCMETTHRALDELGFRVLSKLRGSQPPVTGFQFREISVTLDIFRWQNGATLKSSEEIYAELAKQISQGVPIGIMLHHKVMTDEAFLFIEGLLDELKQSPAVSFHSFKSLEYRL
jgi:peptidoglycan/xylan/chitin deacetylase (PgdA/CDA1 family)